MLDMGQVYSNRVSVPNNKIKQVGITRCVSINCLTVLKIIRKKVIVHSYIEIFHSLCHE